jgi:hypothetical protein
MQKLVLNLWFLKDPCDEIFDLFSSSNYSIWAPDPEVEAISIVFEFAWIFD